jgi:hypothetical protein
LIGNVRHIGTAVAICAPPKIDQLVADAKAELKPLGINTEGKRADELLTMAREARIHPRARPPTPE